MCEVENGYELVSGMTTSNDDITSLECHGDESLKDDAITKPIIESSLFGDTENLLKIDPSRKGQFQTFTSRHS